MSTTIQAVPICPQCHRRCSLRQLDAALLCDACGWDEREQPRAVRGHTATVVMESAIDGQSNAH